VRERTDEPRAAQVRPAAATLRRGVVGLARRLRTERAAAGLTGTELSVLGHLHRRGPLTPGELAAAERVQPQTLTRTLGRLTAAGLITRQPDRRDGRRSLLGLTEPGRRALQAEMQQRDDWLATAMAASLTGTEIELLRLAGGLLEQLAETAIPPERTT
jgi:DNA-binding MarR family transcriptional regulator